MEKIWQKSYAKGVPQTMNFEEISLSAAFKRTVSRFGDHNALIFQDTVITYRELDQMVSRFANTLKAQGVKPGDRVSIILPNLVQTVAAIYGVLAAGAVGVLHNPRLDDMLLEFQMRDANSRFLVALDLLVPRMLTVRNRTNVKTVVSCHIRDYLPFVKKQLFSIVKGHLHLDTPKESGVFEFTDLLDQNAATSTSHKPRLDDTAFILYTSATTGKPKGVELTHRNVSINVQQLKAWFPAFVDGKEVVVGCLPFFHSFGLTCALNIGIYYGYSNILVPLPEPKEILDAVAKYHPTFLPALPNFYNAVVDDPKLSKHELKSLKGCFSGGSPLPLHTIRSFQNLHGVQICEGYGLTESSPTTHVNPFGGKTKVGTIGLPLPETDAKIVDVGDPHTEILAPGVPGELCVRGPQVMKGYVNLPEKTAEALLSEGWLLTGDIVTMDADGYFTVVDRKKDMIVSQEQTVYPRDVEEVLFDHPKVKDACAIGIPDQQGGETIKVFVVLKQGQTAADSEIIEYCKRKLSQHQVPSLVQFMNELPRSPAGKVVRKELKRLHLVQRSLLKPRPSA